MNHQIQHEPLPRTNPSAPFPSCEQLFEKAEKSLCFLNPPAAVKSWNKENSYKVMLWFSGMTDLTLRAEGQWHTANLISKYRKAHSSVLEKSLSCQRVRETVVEYLEVRIHLQQGTPSHKSNVFCQWIMNKAEEKISLGKITPCKSFVTNIRRRKKCPLWWLTIWRPQLLNFAKANFRLEQ